ncbi:hypothetical protein [Dactylosporangium sp. NPDC000521]|uniref:hypothetical protein n=1 Tax=Dactylosporangium sp. NPDC000521 TaxID=3363975 RepID=UPI0036A4ED4E
MGGTALSILSPWTAERVEPVVVEEMTAAGLTRYRPDPSYWYSADGLPYGYDLQAPDTEAEPEELRSVERAAGAVIRCDIVVHILVSDPAGRPALARIAAAVAGRVDGWVFVEFSSPPSADLLRHLSDAGRCVRADQAVYLDAPAMRAWRGHPDFHVVK